MPKMAVVLLRGASKCWGVMARPQPRTVSAARHGIYCKAKFIVQFQWAIPVAGGVAAG